MNVPLDFPIDRRIVDAQVTASEVGVVDHWSFLSTSAASGSLSGQSGTHTVTITASLSPTIPPLIQQYEVQTAALPSKGRTVE
jgi:hypothetical protein